MPARQATPASLSPAPVYRAASGTAAPTASEPGGQQAAGRTITTGTAPADVTATFHRAFGVDVSRVPVHRGPAVSRLASAMAARAFTHRGEVYLPDEAGSTGSDARALLAHELVHATQQQVLGPALPREESAEGRALEATAVATERWFRGEGAALPPLVHPPADAGGSAAIAEYARQVTDQLAQLGTAPAAEQPQRAEVDGPGMLPVAASLPEALEAPSGTGDAAPAAGAGRLLSWSLDGAVRDELLTRAAGPSPQRAGDLPAAPAAAQQGSHALDDALARLDKLGDAVTALEERVGEPSIDLQDTAKLDELAGKLYGHLRHRLRNELMIDRERSGTLTDLR